MKGANAVLVLAAGAVMPALSEEGSPIAKVIQMISDLQTKVIGEGEAAQKEYDEFLEWCEDNSKNLGNEIKTGKAEKVKLEATIEEETATQSALPTKIEDSAQAKLH